MSITGFSSHESFRFQAMNAKSDPGEEERKGVDPVSSDQNPGLFAVYRDFIVQFYRDYDP